MILVTIVCCSCIKGGEEPLSAVILGGRHPGQYFLSGGETLDYLINTEVCNVYRNQA